MKWQTICDCSDTRHFKRNYDMIVLFCRMDSLEYHDNPLNQCLAHALPSWISLNICRRPNWMEGVPVIIQNGELMHSEERAFLTKGLLNSIIQLDSRIEHRLILHTKGKASGARHFKPSYSIPWYVIVYTRHSRIPCVRFAPVTFPGISATCLRLNSSSAHIGLVLGAGCSPSIFRRQKEVCLWEKSCAWRGDARCNNILSIPPCVV